MSFDRARRDKIRNGVERGDYVFDGDDLIEILDQVDELEVETQELVDRVVAAVHEDIPLVIGRVRYAPR